MLYKVEAGKAEYLLHVLKRDGIDYTVNDNGDFILPDNINLNELEEDIAFEEQRQGTQVKIPVYSRRTLENKEKLSRLQEYYGKRGFHVLQQ